jgi:DNA-binding transcriptional MerR regulator
MNDEDRTWRVGELAEATGLSVRTLHHYDEIGLLRAVRRTGAGHRLYGDVEVRRLHRILALRGFGLSLAEVGQVLDGDPGDPKELVRRQLEQVQDQLRAGQRLHHGLTAVLEGLEQEREPSVEKLIELIEGMTAMTRSLTVEEFVELSERRRKKLEGMTAEEIAAAEAARSKWREALTDEEIAELEGKRRELLPKV